MQERYQNSFAEELNEGMFKIIRINNFILMLGKTQYFLEEEINVLKQYSKSVDPNMAQVEPNIIEIKPEVKLKKEVSDLVNEGYLFMVELNKVLPRLVRALYGKYQLHGSFSNCHGMALLGAGIVPVVSSVDSPLIGATRGKFHEVSFENILPGDFIFYKGALNRPYMGGNNHSFIFLDKNICLSMNGRGETLEIFPTNHVIKLYDMPADILEKNHSNVVIFRKNEDWSIPESSIQALLEYYGYSMISRDYPGERNYHRLLPITQVLYDHVLQAKRDRNEIDEKCFKFICDRILQTMNWRIGQELYGKQSSPAMSSISLWSTSEQTRNRSSNTPPEKKTFSPV